MSVQRCTYLVFWLCMLMVPVGWAQASERSEAPEPLVQLAFTFRAVAVQAPLRLDEFWGSDDQAVLPVAPFSNTGPIQEQIWRLFFRQSQGFWGRVEGSAPIIAFYNPLADFWLLTVWQRAGQDYAFQQSQLVLGEHMRSAEMRRLGQTNSRPGWMRPLTDPNRAEEVELYQALQAAVLASATAFDQRFPERSVVSDPLPTASDSVLTDLAFENRMALVTTGAQELLQYDPVVELSARTVVAYADKDWDKLLALAQGNEEAIAPQAELDRFPAEMFDKAAPVFGLTDGERGTFFLASLTNARWLLVIEVADITQPAPRLSALGLVDLYLHVFGESVP